MQEYDIIIIGGGLVGLTMACALSSSRANIAIIEQHPFKPRPEDLNYDPRVYAINRASENLFKQLNIWSNIAKTRISPYTSMHVWDGTGSGKIDFHCTDIGELNLGHIIEHRVIYNSLLARLQNTNVDLLSPITLQNFNNNILNQQYAAKLIIGADGGQSWLRSQAGFDVKQRDYNHHALISTVKTSKPHRACARQCFRSQGPLAFLPLADPNLSSIVWSTEPEHTEQLLQADEDSFKQQLGEAFEHQLGEIINISQRFCFPLQMRHAKDYVKPGLALIGDAAHSIHPLAGQGINLGFQDVQILSKFILEAEQKGRDPYSLANLQRYQRWRKGHNLAIINSMAGLKSLFANEQPAIRWLRNIGLNITNHTLPLKRKFIEAAMGT